MFYETMKGYEQETFLQPDYTVEEQDLIQADKNGGWWITFLLGSALFGPLMVYSTNFPPFRFADVAILFMLFIRLSRAYRLHGGFLFSYRAKPFTIFMFAIALMIYFSMLVNLAIGRLVFYYKDLWIPIVFIRMGIIAAIAASFVLGEQQINQIFKGIIILSLMSVLLAFAQRSGPLTSSAFMNKLYTFEGGQVLTQQAFYVVHSRVMGTFGNANLFGGSLVMLSTMFISFAVNTKGLRRYISIAVYLTLALTILITTASRTSVIGLVIVSGLALILSLRKGTHLKALIFFVLFLIMLEFVRNNIELFPINPRLKSIIQGEKGVTEIKSFQDRIEMWKASINEAKKSILVGVGASKTVEQLTDNGYIYTLLRIGIIGLITYISMIISLFVLGMRSLILTLSPLKRAALLAVTMVVVNSAIFEITGEFFWNIRYGEVFATFMGLLCGLSNQIKHEYQYDTYVYSDNYYPIDEYGSY